MKCQEHVDHFFWLQWGHASWIWHPRPNCQSVIVYYINTYCYLWENVLRNGAMETELHTCF
jgi:hypothetical protein